jgi:hypothetical protein
MARKPCLYVPGALYHMMLRGNGGQTIFMEIRKARPLYARDPFTTPRPLYDLSRGDPERLRREGRRVQRVVRRLSTPRICVTIAKSSCGSFVLP